MKRSVRIAENDYGPLGSLKMTIGPLGSLNMTVSRGKPTTVTSDAFLTVDIAKFDRLRQKMTVERFLTCCRRFLSNSGLEKSLFRNF